MRLVRDHKPNILFLMETRVPSVNAINILLRTHFNRIVAVEARGFAGGLWCFWDDQSLDIQILSYTTHVINVDIMNGPDVDYVILLV